MTEDADMADFIPRSLRKRLNLSSIAADTTAMCWAAGQGNIAILQELIMNGANVNMADYDLRTPLHIAVEEKKVEMVELLLKHGADMHKLDRWGHSALHYAEGKNDKELLMCFHPYIRAEEQSARHRISGTSEEVSFKEKLQNVLVFDAVRQGDADMLKRSWVDGMAVDVTNKEGRTALMEAVECDQVNIVELLLSAGADPCRADTNGVTAKDIALRKGLGYMLQILQEADGEERKTVSTAQATRAFEAVKRGNLVTLRHLVPSLVAPNVCDYDQRSLLHIAAGENNVRIARYLVEQGADLNVPDRWGNSPLADAIDFANNEVAQYLRELGALENTHSIFSSTYSYISAAVLNTALEHILTNAADEKWVYSEAFCPVEEAEHRNVLVSHSVWNKKCIHPNPLSPEKRFSGSFIKNAMQVCSTPKSEQPLPTTQEKISFFRKARALMLIDPGQDQIGRVFVSKQPEWIAHLNKAAQSEFLFAPHARRAGFMSSLAVPMIYNGEVNTVFTWYSFQTLEENENETRQTQRFIKSVGLLIGLRMDLEKMNSCFDTKNLVYYVKNSSDIVVLQSNHQYCSTLENALTILMEDVEFNSKDQFKGNSHKNSRIVDLAIKWKLFMVVQILCMSMNSEDHESVIRLLLSMSSLIRKGVLCSKEALEGGNSMSRNSPLEEFIEDKTGLVDCIEYYANYLRSVSPPEGNILLQAQEILSNLKAFKNGDPMIDEECEPEDPVQDSEREKETAGPQGAGKSSAEVNDCILCEFNVPGHIHPGEAAQLPSEKKPSRMAGPKKNLNLDPVQGTYFGVPETFISPIFFRIQLFGEQLKREYEAYTRKEELVNREWDGHRLSAITSRELYDTFGAKHDRSTPHQSRQRSESANLLVELVRVCNSIAQDSNHLITLDQTFSVHEHLNLESASHRGLLRTTAAVGYSSSRIYRTFLPPEEIRHALEYLFDLLNSEDIQKYHPLVQAYYMFAVFVFYIHPFHDGNGRCGRLVSNLVAKKYGYPMILTAADKTTQLNEYLNKSIRVISAQETARRSRSQRTLKMAPKSHSSTWF